MKRYVILGAGGFAKEVYWHIRDAIGAGPDFIFVDDFSEKREYRIGDHTYPIVKDWNFPSGMEFVAGVGIPRTKKLLVEKALAAGLKPAPPIIHPTAVIQGPCAIGAGSVITPKVVITTDVTIGDHVHLNLGVTVGHDAIIGSYTTCNPSVQISGNVRLGQACLVGVGATILEQLSIADATTVGAAACVVKNVDQPGGTYVGVPAKLLSR